MSATVSEMLRRADRFVFCAPSRSEVHLERREQEDGSVLWAIMRNGGAWTRRRRWEWEPMPSSRTKAYLKRARWTFGEAWSECERIERLCGFGLPAVDVLARCLDALSRSTAVTCEIRETDVVFWTGSDFAIRIPHDADGWRDRELREVAIMAADGCAALGIKVNLR